MRNFIFRKIVRSAAVTVAVFLALLAAPTAARGDTVSWSATDPATSGTAGGTGTWNTSGLNWWTGSGAAAWNNATNDTAAFAGTSGTVTLGTNITAGGLWFNTSGYSLSLGSNTLSLGAASNRISLNAVASALSGTISGLVTGTGNVRLDGGDYQGVQAKSTLNLIGTATGGWSGTTTITDGATLSLSGLNQALVNTSAINLANGRITLTSANDATQATLDRISNSALIASNNGVLNYATTVASRVFSETTGTISLASGQTTIQLTANQASGTQTLTLNGLTRSNNTASIQFLPSSAITNFDAARNRIVVAGATATPAGQIIGPWATVNTGTAGDYARYDAGGNVLAAGIASSDQSTWTAAANAYTTSTAQTLTLTRTIAALRLTATSGTTLTVNSNANLETFGIMATSVLNPTNVAVTVAVTATGSGVVTTPSGGGNLFIATTYPRNAQGTTKFVISAPITDNAGAVTVVKTGASYLELTGANTFSGGIVLQNGNLALANDAAAGASSGGITFAGDAMLQLDGSLGSGRTITINDGITGTIFGSGTVAGTITGNGAFRSDGTSNSTMTYSGAVNVTGPVWITHLNGYASFANLVDTAGVGPVIIGGNGSANGSDFRWIGGTQTFTNRQFLIQNTGRAGINNFGTGALTITRDLGFGGNQTGTLPFKLGAANDSTAFSNEFAGRITDGPTAKVSLTKDGGSTWVLSATNTYTGTTTLTAGNLAISSDANISGTASPLTFNGGTLKILGTSLTSLNTNRSTTFTAAKAAGFDIDDAANTFTVSQVLNQTTGGLTKTGPGALLLTGSSSYTGVTTVSAGVLRLASANALPGGIGSSGGTGGLTINGGVVGLGSGDFTRSTGTTASQVQITGGGGFAAYGADRTVNLGGNGTPSSLTWGSGSFITTAGGTFVLGVADATNMVDFQNPIALNGAVRTVQVNRGSGAVDARLSGVLSGSASSHLTKTGAGVLELTAVNTYSGTTAINAGRFLVSSAGNLSNTARVVVNGSGADFRWNSSTAFTRPLTMTQGMISGTGTISASGGVSIGTNAILSPGNSPGIQAYTTSLAWAPGGTYQWELNSLTGTAGTNWDLVNATSGTFSLAGLSSVPGNQFVLDLITLAAGDVAGQLVNPYDGGSYTFAIASYNPANFLLPGGFSNTAGADLTSLFTINLGNWQGAQPEAGNIAVKINPTATGLDLVIVPEPGALALAGIGIAAAAYALRSRSPSRKRVG